MGDIWRDPKSPDETAAASALKRFFQMGLMNGAWDETAFIDLSMMLLRGRCAVASVELLDWMEEHLQDDPALVAELRALARHSHAPTTSELRLTSRSRAPPNVNIDRTVTSSSFGGFTSSMISSDLPPRSQSAA